MNLTRRDFGRFVAGAGAAAALGHLARTSAVAAGESNFRAMVGIFLFGGNDGWNMVVPTDARYAGYAASRGTVALKQTALTSLAGVPYALHPAMSALNPIWSEGAMNVVLNTGTLFAPLDKSTFLSRPELRPLRLGSHADEQLHWQGLRARADSIDGFMGRIADRTSQPSLPSLISLGGSNLAVVGSTASPLILPSTGTLARTGFSAGSSAKNQAIDALANGAGLGTLADLSAKQITTAYAQASTTNAILTASSSVDAFFVNPTTGAALDTDVSRQLLRIARLIEARDALGHGRQTFFATQGGYDNHSGQVNNDTATGVHAGLLGELAMALAAFYKAMKSMGLASNVTAFTMSDFGRTYRGNAQLGTDHAWGSNHLVIGGGLNGRRVHGAYPSPVLGGADDYTSEGRFIPTISQEEYLGAIGQWHGVSPSDMSYVYPNWSTWSTGGRKPLDLFDTA